MFILFSINVCICKQRPMSLKGHPSISNSTLTCQKSLFRARQIEFLSIALEQLPIRKKLAPPTNLPHLPTYIHVLTVWIEWLVNGTVQWFKQFQTISNQTKKIFFFLHDFIVELNYSRNIAHKKEFTHLVSLRIQEWSYSTQNTSATLNVRHM